MADEIDKANEVASMYLETARRQRKPEGPVKVNKKCLFCDDKVSGKRRWCDSNCRDMWEKENA